MEHFLLAYLFACFSVGLACLGVTLAVALRTGSRLARAFLAFHLAVSVSVLARLLLTFVEVLPAAPTPRTLAGIEYLEAIVGFYGVLFTLPYFSNRLFAVHDARRDRMLAAVVGTAAAIQHVTEYGLGSAWDARGDLFENLLFMAVLAYTLWLGVSRIDEAGLDQRLALRFLVLGALAIPEILHDLFLLDRTAFPLFPLFYCGLSVIAAWTLFRHPGRPTDVAARFVDRAPHLVAPRLAGDESGETWRIVGMSETGLSVPAGSDQAAHDAGLIAVVPMRAGEVDHESLARWRRRGAGLPTWAPAAPASQP